MQVPLVGDDTVLECWHATGQDLLLSLSSGKIWLVSIEEATISAVIAKFEPGNGSDNQPRKIRLVKSNGGSKVFIYDSEEVLYLWSPHTNEIVARTMIQKVKTWIYSEEDDILFVLSHDGG